MALLEGWTIVLSCLPPDSLKPSESRALARRCDRQETGLSRQHLEENQPSRHHNILEQLDAHPSGLHDGCLRLTNPVSLTSIREACKRLAEKRKIIRERDRCSRCGERRIVNWSRRHDSAEHLRGPRCAARWDEGLQAGKSSALGCSPRALSSPFSGLALTPWRRSPGCRAVVGPEPSRH